MAFNPTVIEKGISARFAQAMAQFNAARELSPGIMRAAMQIASTGAYEKLAWVGAVPAVQQWLGTLDATEMADYEYTIKNLDWAVAAPVNENDINDDQTGVIAMTAQLLAQRLSRHPENLMINLLIDGETKTAYDGVAFFSNVSAPRTIDNLLAGTGVTLATMSADLNAALVAMAKFTDDQGEPLNIRGDMIVCPMALENNFRRLVDSMADPTATAGTNTFNPFSNRFTVIGDPRLDADDVNDWYLLASNEIMKPLVYQLRKPASPMMEKTNHTKRWMYSADYRGNGAYGLPHLAIKTVNT